MAWKYIMFRVRGPDAALKVPIIFPANLIHLDVARSMKASVMTSFPNASVEIVSAGMIDSITAANVHGSSETLHEKSHDGDEVDINFYSYLHGIE